MCLKPALENAFKCNPRCSIGASERDIECNQRPLHHARELRRTAGFTLPIYMLCERGFGPIFNPHPGDSRDE